MIRRRKNLTRFRLIAGTVSLAAMALSGQALAQESLVEEITVTARKVEESLNDTPVSVSAFTTASIEQLDINSVTDIARFTPGLSFSSAFGRSTERPVIRGQGNILARVQFGVESGVAYFVDGMYYAGDIQSLDMSNLERVEVIKGPQSALYGRNTYSGAINFVTRRPGQDFSGRARVRGLGDGEQELVGSVGGQLIDGVLAMQAAVRHYEFDGQWTNTVTEQPIGQEESDSINVTLDWTPNESFSLTGRVQYQEDNDGTRPFFLQSAAENNCYPGFRSLAFWPLVESRNPNQYFCGEILPRPIALNDGPDADGVPNVIPGINPGSTFFGNVYSLGQGVLFSGVERELNNYALSASYNLDSGNTLTFQVSRRDEEARTGSDSDHGPTNFFLGPEAFFALSNVTEFTETAYEARLDSAADSALRWSAGVFHYDLEEDQTDIVPGGFSPDGIDNFITNTAAFVSVGWDFSDRASATVELRYADEEKSQVDINAAGMVAFSGATSFFSFAPRVTLDYRLNDDAMLYGIYSEGIKPGGLNGFDGASTGRPSYDEEESQNLEGGIKTALLDGRAQLNLALFWSDISKYQLTTPVADPSGALNSIVTNQADGEVLGIEVDLLAQLSDSMRAGVTYALADSEFTGGCDEFQWSLTSGGGKFTGDPATSMNPSGMGDCSVAGHQFPMGSKHQASAFLDFSRPMNNGLNFVGNINVSYESKRYTQLHQSSYTGAATLVGARIGVEGENWSLALLGRNLTNEDSAILATRWLQSPYFTFASLNVAPPTADRSAPRAFFALPRRERQLGLELSYDF
ncbi:MAG: TonB-dependent receptor [Gammaproteobacteria bacterium]|nr:TonB-dependent receptor [Gammaproteobacteria bacterium]MXX06822.1 TonB-dependent receptor plug domain-containing protein [Gammaproteobacteria bacterium]MYA35248.1 TonB-dependent receptor plug domain-containing protein [Gammaproteobacteria bacterium]MYE28612.1 TonB-dependent receptor plug domain-containing protein [Gammaproteobacteria bacterium]MYH86725.1 TonB-dependent receptor plug domain-containing protein [Gammaproteobacteria bacterium]